MAVYSDTELADLRYQVLDENIVTEQVSGALNTGEHDDCCSSSNYLVLMQNP